MIVAGASLAVGVAAVVGSSNLFATRRNGNEVKVETGAAPPAATTSAALATPTAPASATAAPGTAVPTPTVISLDDETAPRTSSPALPTRPKGTARPAARSAPSLPPKPSPSSMRPDCNPNYFIDEAGNKVFKKECPL